VDGSFISHFGTKIIPATMVEITVIQPEEIIALLVANHDVSGRTTLKQRRKKPYSAIIKLVTIT
jgi:hypothetical protein